MLRGKEVILERQGLHNILSSVLWGEGLMGRNNDLDLSSELIPFPIDDFG